MPSLALLNQGTVVAPDKGIIEPLAAPQTIMSRMQEHFPEHLYSHSQNSLLYKFLLALLGDAGVNSFKKSLLYPRLSNSIFNTHFTDLDKFYGNIFGFGRLEDEIYEVDPFVELVDEDTWQEIRRKDSFYRARCLDFMRGLQLGTTPAGLALICKAASGIDCSIVERWRYLDDEISDESTGVVNIGLTGSRQEFVVVPHIAQLSPKQARRISNIMHRVKPSNTIFSIAPQERPRIEIGCRNVSSSSKYFQSKRLVTGNKKIKYPPVNPRTGLWIEPGIEKEAPTFAFGSRQEFVTWPTLLSATASSTHIGPFNKLQRTLFPHLEELPDPLFSFDARQAYLNVPVQLEMTQPWVSRNDDTIIINNYFPLGYFADPNAPFATNNKFFWASQEALPPQAETITFEFDSERTINYLEFELCTKPISFVVEALGDNGWEEVEYVDNALIDSTREVIFTSSDNSWQRTQLVFEPLRARYMRIILTRKPTPFPYPHSPLFEWSIEIRALRFANIVTSIDDFNGKVDATNPDQLIGDSGIDVLGNSYRTIVEPDRYAADKVIDDDLNTFWQSQANPSRFAVECLYFDISDDDGNPQTIDEIYISPITAGCLMHIYWSNDEPTTIPAFQDFQDWRLWQPIPRHYVLTEGYHSLKKSITAKYIKLEFTKLLPTPYRALELPFKPVRYKTHPSWVQEYITRTSTKDVENDALFSAEEEVTIDYTILGIRNPEGTRLQPETAVNIESYFTFEDSFYQNFENYQTWTNRFKENDELARVQKEAGIEINTDLFAEDLVATIDPNETYVNRFILGTDTSGVFIPEAPLVDKQLIEISSRNDRLLVQEQKTYPDMWFPRTARHAYKILDAERSIDIAYNVAVREVKFYRTDKSFASDEPFYSDTLADDVNVEDLTFVRADWRLIVSDEFLGEGTGSIGDENFDILTLNREVFT
jgi:hypothetical protein